MVGGMGVKCSLRKGRRKVKRRILKKEQVGLGRKTEGEHTVCPRERNVGLDLESGKKDLPVKNQRGGGSFGRKARRLGSQEKLRAKRAVGRLKLVKELGVKECWASGGRKNAG